jgi:mono/diheme cytochrome c family protein
MRILAILAAVLLLANAARADEIAQESRGAYNVRIGDCASCHTAPGHKPFAGGLAINAPFGTIYSTNITPDKEYGIGAYSLDDFTRAVRQGIAKDGQHLYPAMPYPSFAGASDEDISALYDYFMHEVTPVHEKPPETKLVFPFNQRWGLWFWNLFFLGNERFEPRKDHDANWNRGAYLTQTLGHCGACHTPRGLAYQEKGSPDSSVFLSGATLDHWHATDLRGDPASGLGRWSDEDIAEFLKTGHGAGGAVFGSMTQVIENSTQHLRDGDRQALARYLKSLTASGKEASYAPGGAEASGNERPGAGYYASACSSCHQLNGAGKPPKFPMLVGNPAVLSQDPTSLIRIVLQGGRGAETQGGPLPEKMPGFQKKLTDQEIADVVTFIRRSWGNHAQAVTAREVKALREAVTQ